MQIEGRAVIPAKDLVESVLKRANISDYTVLGTVKGDALELMRFKHPFLDFDVPAIRAITSRWKPVPVRCIPPVAMVLTTTTSA